MATKASPRGAPIEAGRFRQGMQMPRLASRLTQTVTDVRIQRVQEISDAGATDVKPMMLRPQAWVDYRDAARLCRSSRLSYSTLWNTLIDAPDRAFACAANPCVAATTITLARGNIDIGGGQ